MFLDDFKSKRAPTPIELVNAFKAIAYVCAMLNARAVARTPLRLYAVQRRGAERLRADNRRITRARHDRLRELAYVRKMAQTGDEIREIPDSPFLDALANPNPHFDRNLMIQYLCLCMDIVGKFYVFPTRPDPSYAPSELWPLHAQYVMPVKGASAGDLLAGYSYLGQSFRFDEVVTGRSISLRDPYLSGYAPMQAVFEQAGLANYYTAVVESTLKNMPRPSGMLIPKDMLSASDQNRQRTQVEVNQNFGVGRQGTVYVTNGAYDWVNVEPAPADLAALEVNKHERVLIANAFDVPIGMLDTESSNRAVAEASQYQHQLNGVAPRCEAIGSAFTHGLCRPVDDRTFLAFDDPVRDDEERRAKVIDMAVKNGTKTINQVLADDGETPVAWGDEPWLPGTLVQPSTAAANREHAQMIAQKMADKPAAPVVAPGEAKPKGDDQAAAEAKPDPEAEAEAKAERA